MNTVKIDSTAVGKRLRALRGANTIETVSASTGISRSALNMYELGCRVPRDDVKIRLADYYGTSVEALFFSEARHEV